MQSHFQGSLKWCDDITWFRWACTGTLCTWRKQLNCLKGYLTLDKSAIIFTWTLITLSSTGIFISSPDFHVKCFYITTGEIILDSFHKKREHVNKLMVIWHYVHIAHNIQDLANFPCTFKISSQSRKMKNPASRKIQNLVLLHKKLNSQKHYFSITPRYKACLKIKIASFVFQINK